MPYIEVLWFPGRDETQKKHVVLSVINQTRSGDRMGAKILDLYYNFIDKIM